MFLCVGVAARVRLTLKQKVILFPSFTFVHGNISAWGIFKSRVLSIATQLNRFHFISGRKCPYQLQSTPISTHWSAASSKHSHLEACYTVAPLHYWNVFIHSTSEQNKKITHMHLVPKMVLSILLYAPTLSMFIYKHLYSAFDWSPSTNACAWHYCHGSWSYFNFCYPQVAAEHWTGCKTRKQKRSAPQECDLFCLLLYYFLIQV